METFWWKRKPPLKGPRLLSCCTRYACSTAWRGHHLQRCPPSLTAVLQEHQDVELPMLIGGGWHAWNITTHGQEARLEHLDLAIVARDVELHVQLAVRREEQLLQALRVVQVRQGLDRQDRVPKESFAQHVA